MSAALKFDAAIGNPPYQDIANRGSSIWQEFVLLNLRVLRRGGALAMIHPPRWRGPGRTKSSSMDETAERLRSIDVEWISMTDKESCGKVFKGVTIPFDSYVARKTETGGFETDVIGTDGEERRACIKEGALIPNFDCPDLEAILAAPGEERVEFLSCKSTFASPQPFMSEERTETHCHPCVWSISGKRELASSGGGRLRLRWSSSRTGGGQKAMFGVPKVMFGVSQQSGIPRVDLEGDYGMMEFVSAIVDEPAVLPLIRRAMDGSRFRRAMDAARFNTEMWSRHVIPLLKKDFWRVLLEDGA